MPLHTDGRLSRRQMLRALALSAAGSTTLPALLSGCRDARLTPEARERTGVLRASLDGKPRFLIVVAAAGGASIIDSFLAVRASECPRANELNTFPDALVSSVPDSPLRAVKVTAPAMGTLPQPVNTDQLPFLTKHRDQLLVATTVGTSVNHVIAQKRSLTGNGAWKGRTVQECVALQYGAAFPIPNVNMGASGYAEPGTDPSLPAYCSGEVVANPSLWPLSLDGARGISGAPPSDALRLARAARNELDERSVFGQTFEASDALRRWSTQRSVGQPQLEAKELITALNVLPDQPPAIPLQQYGLASAPEAARLRQVFPNHFTDPVEGQLALAFLLLKNRVSVTVTVGPSFNVVVGDARTPIRNPPLSFDFSHNDHRGGQAFMWHRILDGVDRLITLLEAEPFDEAAGESLWDRTLIYIATDFGRTRTRPSGATAFGTGHDLNNGVVLISPMVRGNTVLGGVDPATTLAYGFDARTGAPAPGKLSSNEPDIFAGVLGVMGVDTSGSGLPDASAFRKV